MDTLATQIRLAADAPSSLREAHLLPPMRVRNVVRFGPSKRRLSAVDGLEQAERASAPDMRKSTALGMFHM